MKPKVAIVRGKFLNAYEMQFYNPLVGSYALTGFGSHSSYHDSFAFPVKKLWCPLDLPDFPCKLPILNRLFVDSHYLLGLERAIEGFDLVHTAETYFHYTQQCLNAKKQGKVKKVIATVLENIPFNNEGIWGRKAFKSRARTELDHMIALTQKTKDTLITEGADPDKITVISHFIDTKMFAPTKEVISRRFFPKKRDFVLLYTGRLETYKGVYDILDALRILLNDPVLKGYTWWMKFVGDGSQLHHMKEVEQLVGLSGLISHSHVPYDRMPDVYAKADIFIAPSVPTATFEEQYCTALLEAQAAGLPIITTKTGGIPENVASAATLVAPSDPQSIAYSLKNYMLHADARREFGMLARRRAERVHDIAIGARKISDLYIKLLSS